LTKDNTVKRITLQCYASWILLLIGCVPSQPFQAQPTLASLNEFNTHYEFITDKVVDSLTEISLLSSPQLRSELYEVGYIARDNVAVGVYRDLGTVAGWNIETSAITFNHELGIVTAKGVTFTASGKNVVGAMGHFLKTDALGHNIEYLSGIAVWDVRTGTMLKCLAYRCRQNSDEEDGFLGFAVDRDQNWDAAFSENGISILRSSDDFIIWSGEVTAVDASYQWDIGSVAFDPVHHRYAIIFQEGRVYVSDIDHPLSYDTIARGEKGDIVPIIDAQIDATGRWLVFARGETTKVLNLNNGKVLLEINVSNPVLAFDETGELLFVGSANKLAIYSIEKAEKIAEYDAVGITSLAISEDNRLVIWGDTQGVIHVWAKPLVNP
jgi:hypothetical protein